MSTFIRTHGTIIGGSGSSERRPKTQSGFGGGNTISGSNSISSNGNFEGRDPFSFPNSIADIITGEDSNFVRTTRDQFQNQNQGSYTPSFGSGVSSAPANYNGGGGVSSAPASYNGGGSPAPGPTSGQFK